MGKAHSPSLAELGERELLRRLERFAPSGQLADDAALIPSPPGWRRGVVSTDVLVEDRHFSQTTTPPESVGWRAVMANVSDLAAMGADRVVGVTVGLGCPGSLPWHWLEAVYGGMVRALDCHGGCLLGGDCVESPVVSLAMTAIGAVDQGRVIRRRGAQVGDWLVCSGPHGLSSYGLSLLLHGVHPKPGSLQAQAVAAHCYPRARLDVPPRLRASQPPGTPWRVAGTDSSDGLAQALRLLCGEQGLGAHIHDLPLPAAFMGLPGAERHCLWGGEDFELVLALEPCWARTLLEREPGFYHVGVVTANRHLLLKDARNGKLGPLPPGELFDHFGPAIPVAGKNAELEREARVHAAAGEGSHLLATTSARSTTRWL
ncbi:thiamine-phosphate kinase [Candidatus Synechococcus spongiarum]|uniref:thiamine-phosphate kinase n=1 Tax=Candidatus Synechococcus spongiarum TaxID=431041 RepID=UPI0009B88531|nr:thiamine-phosphate kinase [Candidatus Synechococcus spongiarum]